MLEFIQNLSLWYNTDSKSRGHTVLWCVAPRAHVHIPLTLHYYTIKISASQAFGSTNMEQRPQKLLDQACTELRRSVRDAIRLKHYSIRTGEAYVGWITRFILFHDKRHPNEMGRTEIEAFLTHLAVEQNVAASTQNQAFSALLFLYRQVLHKDLDGPIDALRASKPRRLPAVLTKEEARRVIESMSGVHQLMAKLLYGSGLRLIECVRLRVEACPECNEGT